MVESSRAFKLLQVLVIYQWISLIVVMLVQSPGQISEKIHPQVLSRRFDTVSWMRLGVFVMGAGTQKAHIDHFL